MINTQLKTNKDVNIILDQHESKSYYFRSYIFRSAPNKVVGIWGIELKFINFFDHFSRVPKIQPDKILIQDRTTLAFIAFLVKIIKLAHINGEFWVK